jgi:transposase
MGTAEQAKALAKLGAVVSQPNDWATRRYLAIEECRKAGLTYSEIAAVLGVSKQAVSQFVNSYGERGKA